MTSSIPPKITELLKKHDLANSDAIWELPQKKGCWILKHKTIEALVAAEKITFELPQTIFVDAENAVVLVHGKVGERLEWSYGEASPKNNKNAYPVAMAEKRAKDRVALKLLGLHGDAYSEEESDDFKEADAGLAQFGFANMVTRNEYFELLEAALINIGTLAELEEMKPYFSRLSKTDEQIKQQLTARYLEIQKTLKQIEDTHEG